MTVEKRGRSGKPAVDRIGVLVLGMHRSGTSALARVLNLLGCDLPSTLMNAADSNEAGHWESVAIMNLNNQILQSAGSNWYDWLEFNPGWHSSPKAVEFKEKALAVLENEFGHSRLFVLKDPRICRFAPFWLDVLEAAGVQPAIITQVRNPLEVAESLSRRDGLDPALGHLLWLRHVLEAEAGSRGRPRFHASYEELLDGWPALVSEMQTALNLSWPRLSAMASDEIGSFLTEKLRHHVESAKSVSRNPLLSTWLRDAFNIFSRWAQNGESQADHAELDRIRGELNGAAPAFAQLILSSRKQAEELKIARHSIEEQRAKLDSLAADQLALSEESRRTLSEAQTALTRSEAQLESVQGELSKTQSALAQRSAEADEVTTQLRRVTDRLAEAESASGREVERAERLARELEEAHRSIAAGREENAASNHLLREKEEECQRAASDLKELRTKKAAAEERLAERFNEIAVMTRLLADRERAAKAGDQQLAWMRDVWAVLLNGSSSSSLKGRLATFLPEPVRLKRQKARLRRAGLFDGDAYLIANPDVAEAGLDPLWHYINHGITEGRPMTSQHAPAKG